MVIAKLDWEIDFKGRAQHVPAKLDSSIYNKAFYFINSEGDRCFYIEITKNDSISITKLYSLRYTFKAYKESGGTLEVVCPDPSFYESFEILFMESFQLMNEEKLPFVDAYHNILSKYHAFLQNEILLRPTEQIGLLNELMFLKLVLEKDKAGLKHWLDKCEDFQFGEIFVELKATRSKLHRHIINGLAQLSVPPETRKFLVSSLVSELGPKSTQNSSNLYDTTLALLRIIPKASENILLDRLSDRGYFHRLNGKEYRSFNFHFYDTKYIEVDLSFPCINLSTLRESLYSYIDPQKVQYELDLSGIAGKLEKLDGNFIKMLL